MNCEQARSLLTAYRDLKDADFDTTELDVHLERCASCREELARDSFISKSIRALPALEPPPDMYAKLMRSLAKEHTEFMQRSAPGTVPTPEFLKPYLHQHAQAVHSTDTFSALSTAETGPLPIIHARRKGRPRRQMNQFAILGLAAVFLMLLMMGGITSLLMVAHNNLQKVQQPLAVNEPIAISQVKYTTNTDYQYVTSAIADRQYIYYTAYDNPNMPSWMLLEMDRQSQVSTPLLITPSQGPLIVLGSTSNSLVWLQFDAPKQKTRRNLPNVPQHPYVQSWSIRYLPLGLPTTSSIVSPTVILKGVYDPDSGPNWITTPVQGIWFTPTGLLITALDNNGISHLWSYPLGNVNKPALTQIATAPAGHVLTSPTANSDGTQIFWSEEWVASDSNLRSNIWEQQEISKAVPRPSHGRTTNAGMKETSTGLFIQNGMSFHPQVVDDTLFYLSTDNTSVQNTTNGTPSTTQGTLSIIPQTDPSIYQPPLDASIHGWIEMLPLDSNTMQPTILNTSGLATSLQVGTDFVLWQGDKGYQMYDVANQNNVNVGDILNQASFLSVNGNQAVWIVNDTTTTATSTPGTPGITFLAFNWPK